MDWDWNVTIRALIRTGKAEILSRPSVLTLNNRQSTIRVGRDIPIASSMEGMSNYSNKISFKFEYLPTGILLNIRPRINEAGKEVSMLIDTIVSATVPGGDLVMRAADGTVLAEAPTISTRRVQTYGRIANNTPLIIGGLVARELTLTKDKMPLLGDLPLVGALFRNVSNSDTEAVLYVFVKAHIVRSRDEEGENDFSDIERLSETYLERLEQDEERYDRQLETIPGIPEGQRSGHVFDVEERAAAKPWRFLDD